MAIRENPYREKPKAILRDNTEFWYNTCCFKFWQVVDMQNPFKFGKEVSGYQFYDRKSDADSLHRKLADGSTNVVLFAPRRYGKTSLVVKVLEQLANEDGINGICFDMMRIPTLARFCEEYANAAYGLFGGHRELLYKIGNYLSHLHPTVSLSDNGVPGITFGYGERIP